MSDSDNHLIVYLRAELDDEPREILQRTFEQYEVYVLHFVSIFASVDEYVAHRSAHLIGPGRLVDLFLIYEGEVSDYNEICFRVVFDPQSPFPERIEFVSAESGLERIALAGLVGNRTSGELLAQAEECPDEILR